MIKINMAMPKSCYDCPFGLIRYDKHSLGKYERKDFSCCITGKAMTSTKRNRFCPLMPLPEPYRGERNEDNN